LYDFAHVCVSLPPPLYPPASVRGDGRRGETCTKYLHYTYGRGRGISGSKVQFCGSKVLFCGSIVQFCGSKVQFGCLKFQTSLLVRKF
jgi:hypothetical protein